MIEVEHQGEGATRLAGLPDRLRLALRFDPARLAADLVGLEATSWVRHFVTANFTGEWDVLPLRAPRGVVHPILQITSHPGTDAWDDTVLLGACPYLQQVLSTFPCPVGAARLMRLTPGSLIHEHRDADLAPEFGTVRLHVPVATNDAVDFRLNGNAVAMQVGELWYLRLADRHSVANRGPTDRVHLVIDVTVDAWLAERLFEAADA